MNDTLAHWYDQIASVGTRTVRHRGVQFRMHTDTWITHFRWRTFAEKEPETLRWIDQCLRETDLFIDVGANVGIYSLYAAMKHRQMGVFAVEPEYGNAHELRDNIHLNQLGHRVEPFCLAFSDVTGLSGLHIQDITPGAALHTECSHVINYTESRKLVIATEGVCCMTLDHFCDELNVIPDALKIDVDGTELKILKGAEVTLEQIRTVLIEVAVDSDSGELLRSAGLVDVKDDGPRSGWNSEWIRRSQ